MLCGRRWFQAECDKASGWIINRTEADQSQQCDPRKSSQATTYFECDFSIERRKASMTAVTTFGSKSPMHRDVSPNYLIHFFMSAHEDGCASRDMRRTLGYAAAEQCGAFGYLDGLRE
jgi:hypothetical protein